MIRKKCGAPTFNTPFQLSLPPSHLASEVLSDTPESADRYEFSVEHGDVILLATDGIFDNIPDSVLVKEVGSLQRGRQAPDPAEIQVKPTQFRKSVTKILENSHQNLKSGMAKSLKICGS
jgi:serine/threonine protein phosphatase PrpC